MHVSNTLGEISSNAKGVALRNLHDPILVHIGRVKLPHTQPLELIYGVILVGRVFQ